MGIKTIKCLLHLLKIKRNVRCITICILYIVVCVLHFFYLHNNQKYILIYSKTKLNYFCPRVEQIFIKKSVLFVFWKKKKKNARKDERELQSIQNHVMFVLLVTPALSNRKTYCSIFHIDTRSHFFFFFLYIETLKIKNCKLNINSSLLWLFLRNLQKPWIPKWPKLKIHIHDGYACTYYSS